MHCGETVPAPGSADEWLTLDELCARLKVAKWTARNWRRRGLGPPGYLFVGQLRYRMRDVERWERDVVAAQSGGAA